MVSKIDVLGCLMQDASMETIIESANDSSQNLHLKKLSLSELEERMDKLKHICDYLDPFAPMTEESKLSLAEFHLSEHLDPFAITNKLILLLEDTLEAIESRKNEN